MARPGRSPLRPHRGSGRPTHPRDLASGEAAERDGLPQSLERPGDRSTAAAKPGVAPRRRGWIAYALAAVALAVVAVRFLDGLLHALDVFADYHAYYRAAANLRAGADLYAEGKLLVERNDYGFWTQTDGQYVYPPSLALLLAPLTLLDIGKGGVVWLLALAAAAIGFAWAASHALGRPLPFALVAPVAALALGGLPLLLGFRYGHQRFLAALAVVAFLAPLVALAAWAMVAGRLPRLGRDELAPLAGLPPVLLPALGATPLLLGIKYGQVDVLLLLLTTLALLAYLRGHDALAGVALGAAAAVKPTLALYGLFFLRKGRWTTLGAAALTGLVLGLGPFALLPTGAFGDWLTVSRYFTGDDYPTYPSNQSLRGWLLRAFAGGPRHTPLVESRLLADVLWLALAAGALALWWRAVSGRPERGGRAPAEYALTAVLMLFAAPLSEDIHYVALLLPLAVLADRAVRGGMPTPWAALAIAACLYFMQPWLDALPDGGRGDLARWIASGAYLYGLILVGAALVLLLRAARERPPGPAGAGDPAGARAAPAGDGAVRGPVGG